MAVCQNLVPLVNIKIAGKWMLIPLKMVLIGIDPYPYWFIRENPNPTWIFVGGTPILIRKDMDDDWGYLYLDGYPDGPLMTNGKFLVDLWPTQQMSAKHMHCLQLYVH
jgi:hypothetical protein